MLVIGVNKVLGWCHVASSGRRYTCSMKEVDGHLFFKFKKEWHLLAKYVSEHANELVEEHGKTFLRPFSK